MHHTRRNFIKNITFASAGIALASGTAGLFTSCKAKDKLFFDISLAEWSFHNALFDKKMTNLEFPEIAKEKFGITAVEYVNTFFPSAEKAYLKKLKKRTEELGVENVLIMVDREGNLGAADKEERMQSVKNHHKWVDAAKYLGCHSIRVNARGEGTAEEVADAAVDGLSALTEYGAKHNINVIVENHGGYSSDGQWLANVIKRVDSPLCGTLPDFGNFRINEDEEYDRYKGVKELMPYAKGVSAKSQEFDEKGNEINTDYYKMMKIVKEAGYKGYVGIEYSGKNMSEEEGVRATKELLIKTGKSLA
jgi:sugar phosphate isomerase/epimerase